jgi:hypothetical protein
MRRTLPWAVVAFYPLIALAALNFLSAREEAYVVGQTHLSSLGALVMAYWWPFLVVTDICATTIFVVAVLRNRILPASRRILWAVGMVFLGVIVIPAYWWGHSERGAR